MSEEARAPVAPGQIETIDVGQLMFGKQAAAYVCTGCGIGECVDAERVAQASRDKDVPAEVHGPLCVPEGVEFLRKDLKDKGADRAVIAACSQRVNWDVFSPESLGVDLVERVNIRELVAWSKPPGEEETQLLAEDYLRMGLARNEKVAPPPAKPADVVTSILVVGGGISGITAALEAADAGHDVVLVERDERLGGWLGRFHKSFPTAQPWDEGLRPIDVGERAARLEAHPRVTVHLRTEVTSADGMPGAYEVELEGPGGGVHVSAGAMVLATGWRPQEDRERLAPLGFGASPDVVTNVTFERMARDGNLVRPSDGRPAKRIAFVQRPGMTPEEKAFSYGANLVDMVTLKQALYLRELDPEAEAYIFYEGVVAPGLYESFYRHVQEQPGIFFTKGDVSSVGQSNGSLQVEVQGTLIGEPVSLPADLVVLATGMVPSTQGATPSGPEPAAGAEAERAQEERIEQQVEAEIAEGEEAEVEAGEDGCSTSTGDTGGSRDPLHLLYRQGPGIPTAKYGFSNSNFICFPYETRRTGIYAAGSVREPLDAAACVEDATGAALKAIQALGLVASGRAVHPRSGDLSLPHTRTAGCTKCGRCTIECPFSAIELDERSFPKLNPTRCRRCGICMGACPVRVISFEDYSVEQLTAMTRAIEFPEDESIPRILVLACENDAFPAFDLAGIQRRNWSAAVRAVPLRCLGSLNVAVVADALSGGIDGVMLMGCRTGENYQCHFIRGSELAQRRLANVQETLSRLMLEPERVRPVEVEITGYDELPALVDDFVAEIEGLGPNPYKGF